MYPSSGSRTLLGLPSTTILWKPQISQEISSPCLESNPDSSRS